jgi:F1F0 ATPase subunit 2
MSDLLGTSIALCVGGLLGLFFFGGLWWTIKRGITSDWAALWFISSLLVRTMTVLLGFYFVSQHHWARFAACVAGFLLARLIVVRSLAGESATMQTTLMKETNLET